MGGNKQALKIVSGHSAASVLTTGLLPITFTPLQSASAPTANGVGAGERYSECI